MSNPIQCPSCQQGFDPANAPACPNCGFQVTPGPAPAIAQPIRRAQKVSASVLLAAFIDMTGSTQKFAQGVYKALVGILAGIQARAQQVRVYLHAGGDLDYGEECLLLANGVPPNDALAELQRLHYAGGGDAEETHLDNLEKVLNTTPWEADPCAWRNALVVFLTADTKSARSGVTAEQLGAACKAKDILAHLVAEDFPFAREFVQGSNGLFFPISNDPTADQMQQISAGISQSIVIATRKAATRPMTVPLTAPQP